MFLRKSSNLNYMRKKFQDAEITPLFSNAGLEVFLFNRPLRKQRKHVLVVAAGIQSDILPCNKV